MPRISQIKENRIKETILYFLFQNSPRALFTYHIAQEIARDEEYVKKLMQDLEGTGLVSGVKKNSAGIDYTRRIRWNLTSKAYDAYKRASQAQQDVAPIEGLSIPQIFEDQQEKKAA